MKISSLFALSLSLIWSGSAFAQDIVPKSEKLLTLVAGGEDLASLVGRLATSTGLKLSASPAVSNLNVVVSVENMPSTEFFNKLAELTSCVWVKNADSYTLSPSGNARSKDDAAMRQHIRDGVMAYMSKLKPQLAKPFDVDAARKYLDQNQNSELTSRKEILLDPNSRAGLKIAGLVDMEAIFRLQPGGRIVFSTHPTAMQRPLSRDAFRVAEEGKVEMRNLMEAYAERNPNDSGNNETMPPDPVVKIRVAVSMDGAMGMSGYSFEVQAIGQSGQPVDSMYAQLPWADMDYELFTGKSGGELIPLSETSKKVSTHFIQLMNSGGEGGPQNVLEVNSEIGKLLLDPVTHHPLSFAATDAVFFTGKKKKKNILAAFPDQASYMGMFSAGFSVPQFEGMNNWMNVRTTETETCVLMRPILFSPEWSVFAPKGLVKEVYNSKDEATAFDNLMRVARSVAHKDMIYMAVPFVWYTKLGQMPINPDSLKAFSMIEPSQWTSMGRGNAIPWNGLSASQKQYFYGDIFGRGSYLMTVGEDDGSSKSFSTFTPEVSKLSQADLSETDEVTELLPNGIPSGAFMRTKTAQDPTYQAFVNGKPYVTPATLSELAYWVAMSRKPEMFPGTQVQIVTHLRRQKRITRTLELILTQTRYRAYQLSFNEEISPELVPLDKLTKAESEELEKAVKMHMDSWNQPDAVEGPVEVPIEEPPTR